MQNQQFNQAATPETQASIEHKLFGEKEPKDRFDAASRQAFLNNVSHLMRDGGQLKRL